MTIATNQTGASKPGKRGLRIAFASVFVLLAALMLIAIALDSPYLFDHLQRSILISHRVELAERAVARFHEQLNAGQYGEIYAQSTDEMKQATSEAELTKFLENIRLAHGTPDELGKAGDKRLKGAKTNVKLFDGVYVTLRYETNYTLGQADETFVFLTSGEQARLYSYDITSLPLRLHSAIESGTLETIKIEIKDVKWETQPVRPIQPAN